MKDKNPHTHGMYEKMFERRFRVFEQKRQKMLEEYGWVADMVTSEDGIHCNYHTHGLQENFGHPDLQMTLYVDPHLAHNLFVEAVEHIKKGKVFQDGERSPLIIQKFDVLFKAFTEGDRRVLRIILPDAQGRLPIDEGCDEMYLSQLDRTFTD